MDLFQFLDKRVEILFIDNDLLRGQVVHHTIAGDNDPEEESITFIPESGITEGVEVEIMEHEIISIKRISEENTLQEVNIKKFQKYNYLQNKVKFIEEKYKNHFHKRIPDQIIGWWDPLRIDDIESFSRGVQKMEKAINKAISTNTPIEPINDKDWKNIIF